MSDSPEQTVLTSSYRRGLMDAIEAIQESAWAHVGGDDYSQALDAGARHQHKCCLEAVRFLVDALDKAAPVEAA